MTVALIMLLMAVYFLQHGPCWIAATAVILVPFALIFWRMPR